MSIKNQSNNSKQPKKNQQDKLDKELQETFGNQDLNDFRRTLEETSSNQRRKSSFFIPILIVLIILAMLYFIFFN